jgi:hypothetical protein
MVGVGRYRPDFVEGLRRCVQGIVKASPEDFDRRWAAILERSEQPWLAETSSFIHDTWLLQLAIDEFSDVDLLHRPEVEHVFFDHQRLFNRQLIGTEIKHRMPNGLVESVRVQSVFIGPRLGMGFRLRTRSGVTFEIEKFD